MGSSGKGDLESLLIHGFVLSLLFGLTEIEVFYQYPQAVNLVGTEPD